MESTLTELITVSVNIGKSNKVVSYSFLYENYQSIIDNILIIKGEELRLHISNLEIERLTVVIRELRKQQLAGKQELIEFDYADGNNNTFESFMKKLMEKYTIDIITNEQRSVSGKIITALIIAKRK